MQTPRSAVITKIANSSMSDRKGCLSSDQDGVVKLKDVCRLSRPYEMQRSVHIKRDSIDFDLDSMESYFQNTSNVFVANTFPTSRCLDSILEESDTEPDPEPHPHLLELELPTHYVEDDFNCIDAWTYNPPCNEQKQWGLKIWADPECSVDDISDDAELVGSTILFDGSSSPTPPIVNNWQMHSLPLNHGPINVSTDGPTNKQERASMIDCALPFVGHGPNGMPTQVSQDGSLGSSKRHRRASCVML